MKSTKRIDKLTQEQEMAMKPYAQKWIDIGLKTGNADWKTFDENMPICYQKAGLQYPKRVVRVASPIVGAFASAIAEAILKRIKSKGCKVGGAVHDAVGDAVSDAVGGAVGDAVGGAVHDAVGDAVGDAVHDAVGGAVSGAVGGAVRSEERR